MLVVVVVAVVVDVAATQCAHPSTPDTTALAMPLIDRSVRDLRAMMTRDSRLGVAVSTPRRRLYKRSYEIDSNVCLLQEKSPSKLELRLLFSPTSYRRGFVEVGEEWRGGEECGEGFSFVEVVVFIFGEEGEIS